MTTTNGGLQSVSRALRALELIAEAGELGVTELGRRLDVHKATASRLVSTLAERGLVERDPTSERYRLGFGLIRLAGAAIAGLDLVRTAHPILEDLAERTRETVNLGVLSRGDVVYVDQVAGTHSIVSVSWVGRGTPLHCTSNGKALLAWMDEEGRDRLLATPLTRMTDATIVDPGVLRTQLQDVRTRGYAQTIEELEEGLNAVAAPVRGADGQVVAAVSVSGPAFRMRPVDLPRVGRLVIEAASSISRRLGHVERGRPAVV
jgi:IclR family transcriptional regulator, acetate operon repressor